MGGCIPAGCDLGRLAQGLAWVRTRTKKELARKIGTLDYLDDDEVKRLRDRALKVHKWMQWLVEVLPDRR
jgi:hypothetical protein